MSIENGPGPEEKITELFAVPEAPQTPLTEVEKLRHDLDVTSWLLAQLLYELRLNALQQALATPEGQAAMAQKLLAAQS